MITYSNFIISNGEISFTAETEISPILNNSYISLQECDELAYEIKQLSKTFTYKVSRHLHEALKPYTKGSYEVDITPLSKAVKINIKENKMSLIVSVDPGEKNILILKDILQRKLKSLSKK